MKIRRLSIVIAVVILAMVFFGCQSEEKPLSIEELLSLGEKYLLCLDYEQAIVCFTRIIDIDPMNVRAYVRRGDVYVIWNEQLELAKPDYEKAIEIDDLCVDGYLGLVDVYIRMNDFDKALEIAELGYKKTNHDLLKAKVDELRSGNVVDSSNQPRKTSNYYNGSLDWYHIYAYKMGKMVGVTAFNAHTGMKPDMLTYCIIKKAI